MTIQKYPISSRILHWSMSAMIIFLLFLGIYMADFLDKDAPNKLEIYNLHKSFGVVVFILLVVRVLNRLIYKAPPLSNSFSKREIILSHIVHGSLYLLMALMPISGYFASNSFGFSVHFFSIELPRLVETNQDFGKFFAESHKIIGYSMIVLITLHFAGAMKHRLLDKDDTLKRMI
jgi:cytochrome b561